MFNRPSPNEILTDPCAAGDGFLFAYGFALASVGWQFDAEGMSLNIPEALLDGQRIRGNVVCQMQIGRPANSLFIGQAGEVTYEVDGPASLYVRNHTQALHLLVEPDSWRFGRVKDGKFIDDSGFISRDEGFEPGKHYTLVYETEGAPVVGLGLVAIREAVIFLKSDRFEWGYQPPQHAIGFGASQTGRVLRHYLYAGLNDDQDQLVLDGVMPHIAGAQRGDFSHRFAQPSSMGLPALGQLFPFAGRHSKEPNTGEEGDLYDNCGTLPKVLITTTSWEYWRGDAALAHVGPDGRSDLSSLLNERIYLFAGTHHINGVLPLTDRFALTNEKIAYPLNTISYTPLIRAALINALKWVVDGVEPPESEIPLLANGTLVSRDCVLSKFSKSHYFQALPQTDELTRLNRYDLGDRSG